MSVNAPKLDADCLILTGPTASGKTAVALQMAQRLDAEILSVDSVSVYRGLDIGAAKPTPAERARVPHHLVDLVEPAVSFSIADWLAAAATAVTDCRRRGKRILLVGGTPLYLRCLRDGLDDLPPGDPTIRSRLQAEADAAGSELLYRRLITLAPTAAGTVHPHDTKRIIRSLEIVETTGRLPERSWAAAPNDRPRCFPCPVLVLDLPRRLLAERIMSRTEAMFAQGLLDETRAAVAGGGIGLTAAQAAGYTEALACLRGELTEAEAVARTARRTRQLAKRQRTWLRSFPDAVWISG